MSQVTHGLRKVLAVPGLYDFFLKLAGVPAARIRWIEEFLRPFPGARVLDIGCGTAELLRHLPRDLDYTGFDMSEPYLRAARRRHGDRGRFIRSKVRDFPARTASAGSGEDAGAFDIAVAFGVLHHLGDEEGRQVFRSARALLKPEGRLVTIDPAFLPGQSCLARCVASLDRGQNVRTPEAYAGLGGGCFSRIEVTVLRNALRIPTDHAVLVCRA
ncbi:MAG TPA: class I SAM-dependent methyltransferase [Fibrobacteria bacterium]|nr:class I SAM-dependent methyltransferase [Fibrobacteria bacterium]